MIGQLKVENSIYLVKLKTRKKELQCLKIAIPKSKLCML